MANLKTQPEMATDTKMSNETVIPQFKLPRNILKCVFA